MVCLGIDIGGTKIKYGFFNEKTGQITSQSLPTPQNKQEFLEIIQKILLKKAAVTKVGFSIPGKVDSQQGKIFYGGSLKYLDGLNLKEFCQQIVPNAKVAVQNDGKAAVLAEKIWGNLRPYHNGAGIILGTAVGGGIILDDHLLLGTNFQAGEFSFIPNQIKQKGPQKLTGTSGSAVNLIRTAAEKLKLIDKTDGVLVFKELEKHNELIWPIFEEYCQTIAYLIITLQAVLDLEAVVIGGGISANKLVVAGINKAYKQLSNNFPFENPVITVAAFGSEANLYGAIAPLLEGKD